MANTWILLRGLAREKGHWGPFSANFQSRFPGDEVLCIDLPGFGEFQKAASPRSIHEIFKFVRAQAIEKTKRQNQFRLVAISLGGMVAMEWMREDAKSLAGAVLINTSSRAQSPFYNRLRWQVWPKFLKAISRTVIRDREKLLIDLLMNNESAKEAALSLWLRVATEHPASYLNFANQLAAAASFKGLTQKPDVPVLILNGLGDRFVEPSCSEALQKTLDCPMERHPWGGHELSWDDPEWILSKIQTWNDSIKSVI